VTIMLLERRTVSRKTPGDEVVLELDSTARVVRVP